MNADQATYRRIADDLRGLIRDGTLAPGDLLPTQQELAERYGVARMTTRQAVAELVNEGLVTSQQGKGVIVRGRKHMVYRPQSEFEPRISTEMDRFMSSLVRAGRNPSQSIDVAIVHASPLVAARLGVEPGSPVVARKRIRFIDGEPFNINDTFHRYDLAINTEIMNPTDIPRGSNNVLADFGYREVRAIDEFYIRMPDPEEVGRLKLTPGTPVAVHYVTGYTSTGVVTRCDVFVLPGDRHVILYERVHPDDADDLSQCGDQA
jgi:DNA-binding GntR family transcriptional regulator